MSESSEWVNSQDLVLFNIELVRKLNVIKPRSLDFTVGTAVCISVIRENCHAVRPNVFVLLSYCNSSSSFTLNYTGFFYKNIFYKNMEAEICEILGIFQE